MTEYVWNAGPQTINVRPEDLEEVKWIGWGGFMNTKKKHRYYGYIVKQSINESGIRHGKGVNIWPDSKGNEWKGPEYGGDWENDNWNNDKDRKHPEYRGDWNNDRQHGRGTMKWPNGDKYKGNWQFGTPIGNGEVRHDGKIITFFDMRPDGYLKNEYGKIIGSYQNDSFMFW